MGMPIVLARRALLVSSGRSSNFTVLVWAVCWRGKVGSDAEWECDNLLGRGFVFELALVSLSTCSLPCFFSFLRLAYASQLGDWQTEFRSSARAAAAAMTVLGFEVRGCSWKVTVLGPVASLFGWGSIPVEELKLLVCTWTCACPLGLALVLE